jgi:two-component system CheB/CheR fusion protein
MEHARGANKLVAGARRHRSHRQLHPRQKQIMAPVLAGQPRKNIALDLGISQRTLENHRAKIMKQTDSKSVPALARLVLSASPEGTALPAKVS